MNNQKLIILILMLSVLCTACGKRSGEAEASTGVQSPVRAVFVNGALFLDTGNTSDVEGRCGVMDGEITMEVNWENVYGELPEGDYRLRKTIMDLRAPGDYDTTESFAYFHVYQY